MGLRIGPSENVGVVAFTNSSYSDGMDVSTYTPLAPSACDPIQGGA